MVTGLVPPDEQKRILETLVEYYKKLYPGIGFSVKEEELTREQIGEILYTYPGEESQAMAAEKMRMISSAIGENYATPVIILRSKGRNILLDGHRRSRVAYKEGLKWPAYIIVPGKETEFGIESMVMGKVKDLYG